MIKPFRKNKYSKNLFKLALLVLLIGLFPSVLIAQTEIDLVNKVIDNGIGLGSVLSIVASWSRNKSILYAIIHGLLGWLYIIYFVLTREPEPDKIRDDSVNDNVYNDNVPKDDIYKEQKN